MGLLGLTAQALAENLVENEVALKEKELLMEREVPMPPPSPKAKVAKAAVMKEMKAKVMKAKAMKVMKAKTAKKAPAMKAAKKVKLVEMGPSSGLTQVVALALAAGFCGFVAEPYIFKARSNRF